ncbi:hypothetical protein Bbelb_393290 [Branchiostoma belcheri]|nr:hypothetical protein Bbelb_393290 [Branchiostoma belcheri]
MRQGTFHVTSLAEAATHGPHILCHTTALSRDTADSREGCTSVLWSEVVQQTSVNGFKSSIDLHIKTVLDGEATIKLLTAEIRRYLCSSGPYIPVHTTNYQVSGRVRRYHRPAHAVADISCAHPDTPGHAKFHRTCTEQFRQQQCLVGNLRKPRGRFKLNGQKRLIERGKTAAQTSTKKMDCETIILAKQVVIVLVLPV